MARGIPAMAPVHAVAIGATPHNLSSACHASLAPTAESNRASAVVAETFRGCRRRVLPGASSAARCDATRVHGHGEGIVKPDDARRARPNDVTRYFVIAVESP